MEGEASSKMKKSTLITLCLTGVLAAGFLLKAKAELSEAEAREHLKRGALVVDVRTVEEFKVKHLTNAINIPLDEVTAKFPAAVTNNKSALVLLHCRSGRRSGIAETELRKLGYTNVFNMGSFEQAQKILAADNVK
jgi:phage shock protein E